MTDKTHACTDVDIKRNEEKSEVEIKAELPADSFSPYRAKALEKIGANIKVDGFRPGHVPPEVIEKQIGEEAIMREAADMAINEELPKLLAAEEILAISAPQVAITKLAAGNPLGFSALVPVMPIVKLGDYKKIAAAEMKKKEMVIVGDEEVEETITHLRRERAKIEKIEAGTDPAKAHEEAQDIPTLELPGIDDSFVQSLGYTDAEAFKVKLKENIQNEKELREREKVRIAILEGIMDKSKIPLPEILVQHELDKMIAQMNADLAQAGSSFDAYIEQSGQKKEDILKEWREPAEKRAKTQLLLAEIAKVEDIQANKDMVDHSVQHVLQQNKDVNEMNVRMYYEQLSRNEEVLKWLEGEEEK